MPQITLQYVAQRDLGSFCIRWFSAEVRKGFSHVDAVLDWAAIAILAEKAAGAEPGWLLGSRDDQVGGKPAGVGIRPPGYAPFSRRVRFTIPASDDQVAAFWTFLGHQLGKPYDEIAIAAFLFGRDWREDDSWICSELQARAKEVAGIVPRLYLAASKITPEADALVVSALAGVTYRELPLAG